MRKTTSAGSSLAALFVQALCCLHSTLNVSKRGVKYTRSPYAYVTMRCHFGFAQGLRQRKGAADLALTSVCVWCDFRVLRFSSLCVGVFVCLCAGLCVCVSVFVPTNLLEIGCDSRTKRPFC